MRFVLIGGGSVGLTPENPYNLNHIDQEIVKLTQKPHPRILCIGFNERTNFFFGKLKKNFMELGAQCEYLKFNELSNQKTVESKFKRADAIYIGGGNSFEYIKSIYDFGLDKHIKDAGERRVLLCGMSAGAICYSKFGMSDAGDPNAKTFTLSKGLGLNEFLICPHFSNSERKNKIKEFLKDVDAVAICLDDQVAFEIDGENFKVLRANENQCAIKCYYDGDVFVTENL